MIHSVIKKNINNNLFKVINSPVEGFPGIILFKNHPMMKLEILLWSPPPTIVGFAPQFGIEKMSQRLALRIFFNIKYYLRHLQVTFFRV